MAVGRQQLGEAFLSPWNPLGAMRLAAVERLMEGGGSLQLQFPAEDLGVRYGDSAPPSRRGGGRRREYAPTAQPGGRLPHCEFAFMGVKPWSSSSSKVGGERREARGGRQSVTLRVVTWHAVVGGVEFQSGPVSVPLGGVHTHGGTSRGWKGVGGCHGNRMP